MCIGIPHRLEAVADHRGRSESGEVVDLALLSGDVAVGDWVLVHAGIGVAVLDEADALAVRNALEAVAAAARGENVDHLFADLVGREPTLPPHLQTGNETT
ncbi:MAG: HypC/HybG/HupF family hydrogenase formation chaperone [Pseudomonadota bacterium]